ncbi:MAG TPA: restriction endonuclease [Desulfobacteraceae bacterium]|jgi:restriction system protein|nr:restriction endonuclease [Desulfobacteraceae bacterium]
MAIPDFPSIMLPLLKLLKDKREHSLREVVDQLSDIFNLTEEERREPLPSGLQPTFENRISWAKTHLKKAGLLEPTRKSCFKITKRGLNILKQRPEELNLKYLDRFEEFKDFRAKKDKSEIQPSVSKPSQTSPAEALENAYQTLRDTLAKKILQQIKVSSPSLFEKIVVELLVGMGYGGSRKDAGKAIGKSGDEGINGIIKEDRLGLDIIYIQAKKWENTVRRPEIQKFAGALQEQRAKKGICITTSGFSKDAYDYVSKIETKIVLIDGELLAQFMIDHNIGVTSISNYEIKRIDSDYFTGE